MGSSKPAPTYSPGQAAVAAIGTANAGEMASVANQPVEQYGQLMTQEQLGPAQMQAQQALANQAALQGARAQQDIQARVDPMAYAQRQMRMQSANRRLGRIYGMDPTSMPGVAGAAGAYQMPGSAASPGLDTMTDLSRAIASNLSTAKVSGSGADPTLMAPLRPQQVGTVPQQAYSYF